SSVPHHPATNETYTLSLHDALPIWRRPIAVTSVKMTPTTIGNATRILIRVSTIEDLSFLYKFREGDSADKGKDRKQQDNLQVKACADKQGQKGDYRNACDSHCIQRNHPVRCSRSFYQPVNKQCHRDDNYDQ